MDSEIFLDDFPADTTQDGDTMTTDPTLETIKELLFWILGTNLIMIACLLMIAFFVGKASA